MMKLDVIDGSVDDPVEMVRKIMQSLNRDGLEVLGVVVFAVDHRKDQLHTFVGSPSWPEDVEEWPLLVNALRNTVDLARNTMAGTEQASVGVARQGRKDDVH